MSEATPDGMVPVDTKHGDDVDIRAIVVWGLVSVLITVATIAGLHAVYNTVAAEQRVTKDFDAKFTESDSKISAQLNALDNLEWVDNEGKTVAVPIEKAMQITVKEFAQK
ncbi:hypothetical protein NG895_03910 [Aeoliella sp. ICT_H6.2]|uniref:Uncharacterized protein n=1 Tax=Aeoliella straminimaris TaxID=2954799 RepID=A0A9X2F7I6_9BACT|nr:hypothetical protein [Aeoliella straminimaris]MCO6043042.1 hypothetical protein [Aeoliella straminimaris]